MRLQKLRVGELSKTRLEEIESVNAQHIRKSKIGSKMKNTSISDFNLSTIWKIHMKDIRAGVAWVPGILGDYKHPSNITITPGSNLTVTNVVFEAPRKGPTLWEIGIPDRSAAEFSIPDPDPKYKIHQYKVPIEKFDSNFNTI
ncbi:hypothetical protein DH2020_025686 [Rehmannia glutinosa]|uniref:Uncharacterized protein n=1 Tax=Rehmannia glutinosa TaxID=99300 RepID=A0ABR0W1F3_REHGL